MRSVRRSFRSEGVARTTLESLDYSPADVRKFKSGMLTGEDMDMSGLDRSNNDFVVYAHRAFAATFDPCSRGGIKISHLTLT